MSLRVFKAYREYFEEVEILVAGCSLGGLKGLLLAGSYRGLDDYFVKNFAKLCV